MASSRGRGGSCLRHKRSSRAATSEASRMKIGVYKLELCGGHIGLCAYTKTTCVG